MREILGQHCVAHRLVQITKWRSNQNTLPARAARCRRARAGARAGVRQMVQAAPVALLSGGTRK
jgi:hypothetical protein